MDNPQQYLNDIVEKDSFYFLKDLQGQNWGNHIIMLYLSLELTSGSDKIVSEYGAGDYSTPLLKKYCRDKNREFVSYDSNEEWAERCGSVWIEDWGTSNAFDGNFSVSFVDLSPGYFRKRAVEILKGKSEIIVVHDTELYGEGDYQIQDILNSFKYRINYNITQGGAGVSAVSDTIDLAVFDKCTLNEFLLEV